MYSFNRILVFKKTEPIITRRQETVEYKIQRKLCKRVYSPIFLISVKSLRLSLDLPLGHEVSLFAGTHENEFA